MGVINVLDKHVAELIAAGEVVERPASVIKELVENAIDAGAKNITVEIKNGGTTFMRVTDDGCGILREDVRTAFLRHATSKVREEDDLDRIATLGFRGEALASISAVSRLQLITRHASENIGTSYCIEGGEEVSLEDAGCPVGTTFIIRDLFYNIPARAKFLKKDVSEGINVSNIVDKTALSCPEISFTYIRDGKQVLKTAGDGKLLSAVYAVFGREFATSLISVDYQMHKIMKSDTKKQASFRPIISRTAPGVVNAQAIFRKAEQERKQPPAASEKQEDEFNPFESIPLQTPKNDPLESLAVSDRDNPFSVYSKKAVSISKREEHYKKTEPVFQPVVPKTEAKETMPEPAKDEITVSEKENSEPVVLFEQQKDELTYIGELFDTYIIVEKNKKEMLLIDKHAAHERIIYERLKAEKAGASSQLLLQPVTVTLGKQEYDAAISHLDMFSQCSFEVEDFGNSTVIVRAAPQYIDAAEVADCITEMADYISMGKNDVFTEKMDWFYHNVACRSAVKAGNKNSSKELIDIVKTLEENPQIRYCKIKSDSFRLSARPLPEKPGLRWNLRSVTTAKSFLPIPCRYIVECKSLPLNLQRKKCRESLIT